jgi:hypothetical protein
MTSTFTPTEEQIEKVMAKYKPRQIAIAYLRASRRAREAEINYGLLNSITDLTISALSGDLKGSEDAVESAKKILRANAEINETSK